MRKYCNKNNIQFHQLIQYHSPRTSLLSFFYSTLKILFPLIPVTKSDINESLLKLSQLSKNISSSNISSSNKSLALAKWITNTPVIYYPWGLQATAIRFKNSLQENSKIHVITEDVIEASHNGMVPWNASKEFKPILIVGHDDYVKTKRRWMVIKEFFNKNNIDFKEIKSTRGSILSKLVHLIYLLDYASLYHSIILHRDPSPVDAIDFIKKRL